jgi:hypothetical protein
MQTTSKQLTVKEVDTSDEDVVETTYTCDEVVAIAGDSIWDCTITDKDEIRITEICVCEGTTGDAFGDRFINVNVYYTVNGNAEYADSWRLYTDSGFEAAVSELLGFEVGFTEQGMQEDGVASMEA